MQFWEDAFLDAVSQERDMIGMDQVRSGSGSLRINLNVNHTDFYSIPFHSIPFRDPLK